MNKTILPVPVLAESQAAPILDDGALVALTYSEKRTDLRQARESTNVSVVTPEEGRPSDWSQSSQSRGGQKLFVIRRTGRFFIYVTVGPEITERVTARDASLIWDYLEANWPCGTRVYWIIL